MTPRQTLVVQTSFRAVQPILADATVLFYDRLFELDPSLRRLFQTSPTHQTRLLAQALTTVVSGLQRPDEIRPAIEALGRRHVGYGVREQHYAVVGEALLWTLERGLGDAFTPEVRDAWIAAYGWISSTMQRAAAEQTLSQTVGPIAATVAWKAAAEGSGATPSVIDSVSLLRP